MPISNGSDERLPLSGFQQSRRLSTQCLGQTTALTSHSSDMRALSENSGGFVKYIQNSAKRSYSTSAPSPKNGKPKKLTIGYYPAVD